MLQFILNAYASCGQNWKENYLLTVLVTVHTGKHHLLGLRELLPHHVGCLLKNGMEHLTEPTPAGS